MKNIKFTWVISFLSLLVGCGHASDTVLVKLNPGFPLAKKFPQLNSAFFSMGTGGRCVQNKVFAGYAPSQDEDAAFNVTNFGITYDTTSVATSTADLIGHIAIGNSITLTVPRSQPIQIGATGILYATTTTDAAGNCVPTATPADEYTFVGHEDVSFDSATSYSLPTFVAGIGDSISATANNGRVARDFTTITNNIAMTNPCITGPGYPCNVCFRYRFDKANQNNYFEQCFQTRFASASMSVTVPHFFPIETHIYPHNGGDIQGKICEETDGTVPTTSSTHPPTFNATTGAFEGGDCVANPN